MSEPSAVRRGHLPADGDLVTVSCGCTGMVLYTSRHAVHVKVGDPCPGHPERFSPGVIGHFRADQIRPVVISIPEPVAVNDQYTLDLEGLAA